MLIVLSLANPGLAWAQSNVPDDNLTESAEMPVLSVSPVVIPAPGRGQGLSVRVSAPLTGSDLPIIVFAHGNALSSDDYAPLVNYWASQGFVVIQPTFLDAAVLNLAPGDPRRPSIWRYRVEDMKRVLENLDLIENTVPGLEGRMNRDRIAAAGHSYGGITAGMLLGARVIRPDGTKQDLSDPRIDVGILLATAGRGGEDLSDFAVRNFPFMNPSFAEMTRPVLVIAGIGTSLP
ncbi:alpha/beta hydrolase family protein [Kineobactrum salinum]|uniref:alpha/beta hydrolase family protein n=1 Tax=Kineobactrum salinum TaxID=2708301 RepID=UPI0018D81FE4|nr:alpha/beta fold hydrolase [Kineobactrum salinum]